MGGTGCGESSLALLGRAMTSKSLIQFSADKWCCASLPLSCLAWGNPNLESKVGLLVPSKRTYANMPLPGLMLAGPLTMQQASADPCLCSRHSNTHRHVFLSLLWGHCFSFPWSWYTQGFVCSLQESLFPLGLWKFYDQILLSFRFVLQVKSCSLSVSLVYGIFQARILEWVAISPL